MNPRIPFAILAVFAAAMLVRADEPKPGLRPHERSFVEAVNRLTLLTEAQGKALDSLNRVKDADEKAIARMRVDNDEIAKAVADLDQSVKALAEKHELGNEQMRGLLASFTQYSARIAKLEADVSGARKPSQSAKKAKEEDYTGPPTWTAFVGPLALRAASAVRERYPERRVRVAVFAFGDEKRKIGLDLADSSNSLQSCLIDRLTEAGKPTPREKGSFSTLDRNDLSNAVARTGKDLESLSPSDPAAVAKLLKAFGIDVGILGTFYPERDGPRSVGAMVVFDDGSFVHLFKEDPPRRSSESDLETSDRLGVQLLLRDGLNKWKPLPFITTRGEGGNFGRNLFVEIPKDIEPGTAEAEFIIRLRNSGDPPLFQFATEKGGAFANPRERERLFAAAVRIDGVDSFYRSVGANEWKPKAVEESQARRWILTGPGYLLQAKGASGKPELARLTNGGLGHSVIDIVGFQKGSDAKAQAARFRFGPVNDSVAEMVGVDSEVGLITVTFYAEKMKGDGRMEIKTTTMQSGPPNLGVMPGTQVANPAFEVVREWRPDPVATWRIFYRRAGDVPIPPKDRYLIPVAAPVKNPR